MSGNSSLEAPSALFQASTFPVLAHHTKQIGQLLANDKTPQDHFTG
jgi:hypothetical protein